ncbi:hypothetical protein MYCTH_94567 [Thermothelomyces thermophilus ATCC 42464]|uniref:Uncharacterized protein n=1 Tax=Thermothelomyces thermophilus (strain ATCC 42464 / BCRC 31852 / DSM 1799) TaxID=573729 RepID=G2QGL5_THET4|nr:uncharacterized protein MYCTH_94567 [Thermothelomyces thermophilus ATCC 42464]AEO59425.1 hypothetical protein MYCTH_94567 [Thermothelomyces thermophilus ATCC 42464]
MSTTARVLEDFVNDYIVPTQGSPDFKSREWTSSLGYAWACTSAVTRAGRHACDRYDCSRQTMTRFGHKFMTFAAASTMPLISEPRTTKRCDSKLVISIAVSINSERPSSLRTSPAPKSTEMCPTSEDKAAYPTMVWPLYQSCDGPCLSESDVSAVDALTDNEVVYTDEVDK